MQGQIEAETQLATCFTCLLSFRLQQVPHHSLKDADIEAMANAAHGYVGADLVALVNEAALVALR